MAELEKIDIEELKEKEKRLDVVIRELRFQQKWVEEYLQDRCGDGNFDLATAYRKQINSIRHLLVIAKGESDGYGSFTEDNEENERR